MATFQYIAKDSSGDERRGTIEAADRTAAIEAVRAKGLTPTAIGEVKGLPNQVTMNRDSRRKPNKADNVDTLQRYWFAISEGVIGLVAIVLSIYIHIHWWIGWLSFLTATGAFLLYAITAFPFAFSSSWLGKVGWDDEYKLGLGTFEVGIAACLSVPLWYYHVLTPGHEGFWSWIMGTICIGVPLCLSGLAYFVSRIAYKKDRDIENENESIAHSELEALKEKWRPYELGVAGVRAFRDKVDSLRKALNLHFANKCCMRMVLPSSIQWQIVDEYIDRANRGQLSESPEPSCANMKTVFYVKGNLVDVSLKLEQPGSARMEWHNGVIETFHKWEDLIAFLDSKV